jgi:NADPH-dependent glutamate synthase beta subunit-like oxidoreductase/dihydroorotate dehydrogenase/Pyruvate/2-oxoacid:ferredoxin oxidoreductase delta subunit
MKSLLTNAQLKAELNKCEYCEEKPCKEACPVDCSPADFIMAVKKGENSDYERAAAIIMGSNPLGGICGYVCPDYLCMKACVHKNFNEPVKIPPVQATIIASAKKLNSMPEFIKKEKNGFKVAVIGAGPAGLGAASVLAQKGYEVEIFERDSKPGGMCNLIPDIRLDKKVLKTDIDFLLNLGNIKINYGEEFQTNGATLTGKEKSKSKETEKSPDNFDAIIFSTGLSKEIPLGIKGEEYAHKWILFLKNQKKINIKNHRVAVIGGGAVAVDCALTAKTKGAKSVEMIMLEKLDEMPLTEAERNLILQFGIEVTGRIKVNSIIVSNKKVKGVYTQRVYLPENKKFRPKNIITDKISKPLFRNFDTVIIAIGARPEVKETKEKGVFYTGDMANGATTVVEAVTTGKNTAAIVDAYIQNEKKPKILKNTKSRVILSGRVLLPVSIESEFFGRNILSPFLLSAAPPSDGYDQMKKAYGHGWAGGVMKTAFDNVPIHIPSEYMFAVTQSTYGNCDNVSGHPLDRVCSEIEKLVKEFPERLTMASTGGPVTGIDKEDKKVWVSNTKKLENAGVMGIEYSLSCPQGGDGTKGDIVSQDAELTGKIIDWVMEASDYETPKLFKLTAAVTVIYPIITEIKRVFAKYPGKKAGVTLANTFPSLTFRKGKKENWEEGIVIGLSGEGVIPISNLTLANVSRLGVVVSGNGGPMDYKSAADFLALGAETVQFCTVVMKYGYGIIDELHSGLSYLLKERGLKSVKELIGCALPSPITGFMELTSLKKISDVNKDLCEHCGNCTRCPYQAIELNNKKIPITDASKCIGCSICVQKCFSGALFMRERTEKELEVLVEV